MVCNLFRYCAIKYINTFMCICCLLSILFPCVASTKLKFVLDDVMSRRYSVVAFLLYQFGLRQSSVVFL
jgi:hypothetical protein